MKKFLLLFILLGSFAKAESIGGVGLLIEDDDDDVQVPVQQEVKKPAPSQKAQLAVSPVSVSEARPVPTPAAPTASTKSTGAPFQPTLGTGRCPEVIPHPDARNTPVKVYVDQLEQKIYIDSPDLPQQRVARVSTGGGLKIPNGKNKKSPYCAETRSKDRLIISAATPEMFQGTGCTPEEIKYDRATVFSNYTTDTFTDEQGNPIPMPYAVRISGGVFFHEVPGSYAHRLGYPVSGECVRLPKGTAQFLQAQIKKYGAIEVTISERPKITDSRAPGYCTQEMVAQAIYDQRNGNTISGLPPQSTGTEGYLGGEDAFQRAAKDWNRFWKGVFPTQRTARTF